MYSNTVEKTIGVAGRQLGAALARAVAGPTAATDSAETSRQAKRRMIRTQPVE
jgi:hypothetical protein